MDTELPLSPPDPRARLVAVVVTSAQTLAIVAFAVLYAVELASGAGDDATRVAMSIVLMLVFAAGLAAMARGLWRDADASRTPTIVWNVLLLPVAWGLFQSGRALVGALVLVTSVAAIWAAVRLSSQGHPG